ncbi:MAG: bifunctional diaminohydroxyphosphoribosylaminopyrimidine deaminase/5-amino-6-(5-phosphoribosylamino)uracil reductase RibD [Candidatus Omnitrophica bacterium]|nr:bifunctional diaminohydroxyphosphoribosylaminopyrimidine deaminase/5-amino-6-(5-phosphoribosylamino)uracil reductase RibD [Candidatus Omnitrophota bacterium]
MNTHEHYMHLAIDLAKKAQGRTSPNPIVGAVIVKSGRIVGKGYHKRAGMPHAEIEALRQAGSRAKGATLYVTLEPCDHFGRTPPCTDAVVRSGIKEAVIAMKDPNPANNGRGIRKLKRHGIKTTLGTLEAEAREMNRPYMKWITTRMPYVTVKVAQSLDGKIAARTGDSRWISSEESRRLVHGLRGMADAVMVGVNTVIKDDPLLTNRSGSGKQPIRVVLDSALKIPLSAKLVKTSKRIPLIIATTPSSSEKKMRALIDKGAGVAVVRPERGRVDLRALLKALGRRGITHIMAEGGGELVASLTESRLADRFLFFIAPKLVGGRAAPTSVEGAGISKIKDAFLMRNVAVNKSGSDILVEAEA